MSSVYAVRHADPTSFWGAARSFLANDELGNTQLLALGSRYAEEPGDAPPACFTVEVDASAPNHSQQSESRSGIGRPGPLPTAVERTAAAAILLPPRGTLFVSPAERHVLAALIDGIAAHGLAIGDIVGRSDVAKACAALVAAPYRTHVALELHRLTEVTLAPDGDGAMREATAADFDLLHAWQLAFMRDANIREGADEAANHVRRRIGIGGAWLWEVGGVPVAHAGWRPTPIRSARIAPVYTPHALRGRGYASALVSGLSRHLLAGGRAPVYLFADAANPKASAMYRRIGFVHVGDHLHLMRADA